MKDRPEKEPGCWYAERAEEEGKELELGRAPEIKSSAGAGVCIATRHKVTNTVLVNSSHFSSLTKWQILSLRLEFFAGYFANPIMI